MSAFNIKKGNLVEFTESQHRDYTMGDKRYACYGVAIEDERSDHSVQVKMANGAIRRARFVQAYGWAGWIPEGLEAIWEELNPDQDDSDPFIDYD